MLDLKMPVAVEHILYYPIAAYGLECQRSDYLRPCMGQYHVDVHAAFAQGAYYITCLIGGYGAGDAHYHMLHYLLYSSGVIISSLSL